MNSYPDTFSARATLDTGAGTVGYFRLGALEEAGLVDLAKLPISIRIVLENILRHTSDGIATDDDVRNVASWSPSATPAGAEIGEH